MTTKKMLDFTSVTVTSVNDYVCCRCSLITYNLVDDNSEDTYLLFWTECENWNNDEKALKMWRDLQSSKPNLSMIAGIILSQ